MNKHAPLLIGVIGLTVWLGVTLFAKAQNRPSPRQDYEYAIIKWDGPDKLQFITPEKTEFLRAFKSGVKLPADVHDEEFCVVWAVNRMAKEGWEVVTLHSTRVMLRRPLHDANG